MEKFKLVDFVDGGVYIAMATSLKQYPIAKFVTPEDDVVVSPES